MLFCTQKINLYSFFSVNVFFYTAPVLSDNIESTTIDGEYIVVFHDNTNQQTGKR